MIKNIQILKGYFHKQNPKIHYSVTFIGRKCLHYRTFCDIFCTFLRYSIYFILKTSNNFVLNLWLSTTFHIRFLRFRNCVFLLSVFVNSALLLLWGCFFASVAIKRITTANYPFFIQIAPEAKFSLSFPSTSNLKK